MGKNHGAKEQRKRKPEAESEEEQEEEQEQSDDQEQVQEDLEDYPVDDEDDFDISEIIPQAIATKIEETQQNGEKLSWAALLNLRSQQHQLTIKMDQQMMEVQRKYLQLQKPLADKVSDVVAGNPVDKELYNSEQTEKINHNKDKPKPIKDFWLTVMMNSPLTSAMDAQIDTEILQSCVQISSELVNYEKQHIKFAMTFDSSKNQYFKHEKLSLDIHFEEKEKVVRVQQPEKIEFTKPVGEHSLFELLFSTKQETKEIVLSMLWDFHPVYINSVKVYFQGGPQDYDEEDDEENGQEGEEGQDSDEPVVVDKKKKKVKGQSIEKPECKQQ